MLGENPVRQSVTPISSAIDTNMFLKISNSIGSMCMVPSSGAFKGLARPLLRAHRRADGDHVTELIDTEHESRRHHRSCLASGDHRGPGTSGTGAELFPPVER